MDTISGVLGYTLCWCFSTMVWWLLDLLCTHPCMFVCVCVCASVLMWKCVPLCTTQHTDAVCEQNYQRLFFSLPHHLFSVCYPLLFSLTEPDFYPSHSFHTPPFSASLHSHISLLLSPSYPSDRQSECSRSGLDSPFWPSSPLVRKCSVHPGWKTDGTRRQEGTETEQRNQRERQREIKSYGNEKSKLQRLGWFIVVCDDLIAHTGWNYSKMWLHKYLLLDILMGLSHVLCTDQWFTLKQPVRAGQFTVRWDQASLV